MPASLGRRPGCHLTTLFGTETVTTVSAIDAPEPKKHGWLPLLIVLFLVSYGLMTMLIVEQGRTIESQRALIRELLRDSNELSATKTKTQQDRSESLSAKTLAPETRNPSSQYPSTQIPSPQAPTAQYPSTHIPSTQAPTSQAPSSQAGPQHGAQNQSAKQKPEFRMPSKPEADLVDDVRTLITI